MLMHIVLDPEFYVFILIIKYNSTHNNYNLIITKIRNLDIFSNMELEAELSNCCRTRIFV